MNKPSLVGVWVMACTPEQDLIHWGNDGDTEFPYSTVEEAASQARYLVSSPNHENDRIYLVRVFSNGQIRTEEVE